MRPELVPLTLEFDRVAFKQLSKLSNEHSDRIVLALEKLAASGFGDIKDIGEDSPGSFRLQVGDFRVYFDVQGCTIQVRGLEKRVEAYKRKSRNR